MTRKQNWIKIIFILVAIYFSISIIRRFIHLSFYGESTIGYVYDTDFGHPYSFCRLLYFYEVDSHIYKGRYDTSEPECKTHRVGDQYNIEYSKSDPSICKINFKKGKVKSNVLDSIWHLKKDEIILSK
jgi:hypothetical protein